MEVHETGTVTPGHSRHLSHRSPKARPLSSARVCSSASPVQQHSPAQRMASAPCSRLGAKAPLRESVSAPVLKAVPAPWHPAPCPAPRIVEHRRQWECHATKAKGFGDPSKLQKPKPVVQQPTEVDRCPCESKKSYKNCCQRAHEGTWEPPTPEAAVRARFAAYVRNQPSYIIKTTHPDYFPYHYNGKSAQDDEAQMQFSSDVEQGCTKFVYADFKVVGTEEGGIPDEGYAMISYKSAKAPEKESDPVPDDAWTLTDEKCRFLRVDGKWLFVDYQEFQRNLSALLKNVEPTAQQTQPQA